MIICLCRDLEDAENTHILLPLCPLNHLHCSSMWEEPPRSILRKLITGKLEDNNWVSADMPSIFKRLAGAVVLWL